MRQSTYDNNILSEAIITAKKLRALSLENAKYSLKEALSRKTLPLQRLVDLNHLPDIEFIDAVLEQSRAEQEDDSELNPQGLPYLNNKYKKSKRNTDDELEERGRYNMYGEFDGSEKFEYGDDEFEDDEDEDNPEDEDNFSDKVIDERIRKWKNLHSRRNFRTSPAVRPTKITKKERELLIKHAGLIKENKIMHQSPAIKNDLLRQRAGINKSDKHLAKQVVRDLDIKKKLAK
jgi:hypothetical protein